ncbi:MAG: glycosyltransferase family 4 protein [Eubacteriales bacterium]
MGKGNSLGGNKELTVCRLIFEFYPRVGGSITHTVELAKYINPYCKKQFLIVPKADMDTTELDKSFSFEVYRVNYFDFKGLHSLKAKYFRWLPLAPLIVLSYGLFALPQIIRLNRKYGIDIIHAHGISTGAIATIIARLLRKPIVWMIDGTQEAYSEIAGRYESVVAKLFSPDHAFVVDDGSVAPQKFIALLNDKMTVVYHGINSSVFCSKMLNRDLLNYLGLHGSKFVILSAHSLNHVKGIEHAISSFGEFLRFCSSKPDAVLLVVGDGSLKKYLEKLTHDLGISDKALFIGGIDNAQIPEYLSISDIAVATSTYSNMNLSVQEAMACGKPVVAFNSGGTEKIIKHMETGLLAKSGDVKDLAEKMYLLYKNAELRKKIGENARRFIVENRSWESRIRTELEIYEKILRDKAK